MKTLKPVEIIGVTSDCVRAATLTNRCMSAGAEIVGTITLVDPTEKSWQGQKEFALIKYRFGTFMAVDAKWGFLVTSDVREMLKEVSGLTKE